MILPEELMNCSSMMSRSENSLAKLLADW